MGRSSDACSTARANGKLDCSAQANSAGKVRLRRNAGALHNVYRAISATPPRCFPAVFLGRARNRVAPSNIGIVSLVFRTGRAKCPSGISESLKVLS